MNCRVCGASLSPGARVCPRCGMAVGSRPTGEEVRARIQGGGRHAAPSRRNLRARHGAPGTGAAAERNLPLLAAGFLWLIQVVLVFVRSFSVNMNYGDFNLGSASFSVYAALKEGGGTVIGVLLFLLCLGGLASVVLPGLLTGRRIPVLSLALAVLTLVFFLVAVSRINSAFDKAYFGVKPHMGAAGWVFLLNCALIAVLSWLAGRLEPIPAAAPRPAPSRPAPVRTETDRRAPASVRPATHRNVTPPDAETIAALRRMAEMHRQGLVSDEEFARIKAECVARGWIRE